jgi:hypothetical protein
MISMYARFAKWGLYLLVVCGVLGGLYYGAVRFKLMPDLFTPKEVTIAETSTIVQEVKTIAELFSACYYDEVVLDTVRSTYLGLSKQRLVYTVRGRVYAGFDLSALDSTAMTVTDSTIQVRLPEPVILDVVVNPSDYQVFLEEGEWSFEDVTALKNRGKEAIRRKALEKGIIENGRERGRASLEAFLKALGFARVEFV